jgi:hypothetical protein
MKFRTIRLEVDKTVTTDYGTAINIRPRPQDTSLGDRNFEGILSTLTLRMETVPNDLSTLTCRLTEDEDGDKATMPDATCGITRGITTDTMTTSVYKYEVQFIDEYPINLFVKCDSSSATLKEIILQYRTFK